MAIAYDDINLSFDTAARPVPEGLSKEEFRAAVGLAPVENPSVDLHDPSELKGLSKEEFMRRVGLAREPAPKPEPAPVLDPNVPYLDHQRRMLAIHGKRFHLRPTEYAFLKVLFDYPGKPVPIKEIVALSAEAGIGCSRDALVHSKASLVKTLGAQGIPDFIVSHWGVGYCIPVLSTPQAPECAPAP